MEEFPHFLVAGPKIMRGGELERIFFLLVCEPLDSRELLVLSLRGKRAKWGENFRFVCGPEEKWEHESFMEILITLKSQRRDKMKTYLSFDIWSVDLREGEWELFESSLFFEKVKEEMRWSLFIAWYFGMMRWISIGCMCKWNYNYNISCIIHS